MTRLLNVLFPTECVSEQEVVELVRCAFKAADDNYGELEAQQWGGDFVFPPNLGNRDADRLSVLDGNLASLTRERQAEMAVVGRLSVASIHATIDPTDSDFNLLLSLVNGIPIITASSFEPNKEPPPLRAKYLRVSAAVNKMMYDL